MKELSLNILDISENSVKAGAKLIEISLVQTGERLTLEIKDDGCGMTSETVKLVTDPFYTTRTTRKVGLGLPFLKLSAEQTGGSIDIVSRHISEYPESHGTIVTALFYTDHIDFTPLGDIISTIVTLIQGHPEIDFIFSHTSDSFSVRLDTTEMREVLGDSISLSSPDVLKWVEKNLREQYGSEIGNTIYP